jgi:hypothetical protein
MPRGETGDSHAFFANLERFQTHKWLYADLGYLLVAWAILLLVLSPTVDRIGIRPLWRTSGKMWPRLLLTLFGRGRLWVGLLASVVQPYWRGQIPNWADSLGIPFMAIDKLMTFAVPFFLAMVAIPAVTCPLPGQPVFVLTRPPHWPAILATAVYGPFIVLAAVLSLDAIAVGGWALSPAGVILGWVLLGARASLIGEKRPRTRPKNSGG